eukprot:GHVT01031743.1.p5 GENE.GHVT01031743.1~~GHVT01031743.1.p5  ORF type:complete len:156 (+),score=21.63 GHVT01031743.1:6871-7338(+)
MLRPHPRLGKSGENFVYGVRELHVYANRLRSVVSDCREAANSDDARDKYFITYTAEFDPALATRVSTLGEDVASMGEALAAKTEKLSSHEKDILNCGEEKKKYGERMKEATASLGRVAGQFEQATGGSIVKQQDTQLVAGSNRDVHQNQFGCIAI